MIPFNETEPPLEDRVNTLASRIAGLLTIEPVARATQARDLIEHAKTVLSAVRRSAIAEATSSNSYRHVAGQLGVSAAAVNKAVVGSRSPVPVIFAFRDQAGGFHGDDYLLGGSMPYEQEQIEFRPANTELPFAGQLLTLYFGAIDDENPGVYTYTTVQGRVVRPTQAVHDKLFGGMDK